MRPGGQRSAPLWLLQSLFPQLYPKFDISYAEAALQLNLQLHGAEQSRAETLSSSGAVSLKPQGFITVNQITQFSSLMSRFLMSPYFKT